MSKPIKISYSIPKPDHDKWGALLKGELDVSLKNFFFQMKVTQAANQLRKKTTTLETASNELYKLCKKYATAKNMYEDLVAIFGAESLVLNLNDTANNKEEASLIKKNDSTEFYKKAITQKEKEIKEKDNLILSLQEEITLLKKKYALLQKGLKNIKKTTKQKSGWSFTNLFKK